MVQHYQLGQWLRKRYITDQPFLNPTYKRTELKVISTDYDRTIMSADANLQGLYPRSKDLGKGTLWRPIPVYRLPNDCDMVSENILIDLLNGSKISNYFCYMIRSLVFAVFQNFYIFFSVWFQFTPLGSYLCGNWLLTA